MTAPGSVLLGLSLQPERRYLELLDEAFHVDVDDLEITPETLFRRDERGAWVPNGFYRRFADLAVRTGKRFVGHAVSGSLGSADPADRPRQREWLARVAAVARSFDLLWLSDHLGATTLAGRTITLPIAVPMEPAMAAIVRERLMELQTVVPEVGFENSAFLFLLGPWLEEPAFIASILRAPRTHLVLDLHNVHTMAQNLGADPREYLRGLDLARVIEIHLSGGSWSEPHWLPSGDVLRLDSHDDAVPEEVWQLYEEVLPGCANLRGVTLERMEGTVDESAVPRVRSELARAREVLHARR